MIVCVGGAVLDRKYRAKAPIEMATSNPADGFRSFGGVGRNICENLARLGARTAFVSMVGDDESGRAITRHLAGDGVDVSAMSLSAQRPTAEYVAILEPGNDLALGIADMAIFDELTPDRIAPALAGLGDADWVLFDCNLPQPTIEWLVAERGRQSFRIACDTVSTIKATKLVNALPGIDLVFTNSDEARAIKVSHLESGDDAAHAERLYATGAKVIVLTQGAAGLIICDGDGVRHQRALPAKPVDVTGAGDALVAGTLNALHRGASIDDAARDGVLLATLTIESPFSVLPHLSADFLSAARARMAMAQ
jgi:pseudouridine kinase